MCVWVVSIIISYGHCTVPLNVSFANILMKLTCMKRSICRCQGSISNLIHCKYSELKQVTSAIVGCSEVELWFIHTAVGGEWSPPQADVVHLYTIPEIRVHSSDVQGEGRGPGEEDGWPLRVYCKVLHCS